jgi:hypothetical protein
VFEKLNDEEIVLESDAYSLFLFGIRSPKTKEKLIGRLEMFLNFLDLPKEKGTIQERCNILIKEIKKRNNEKSNNNNWITHKIILYLQYQKERVEKQKITAGTLKNYCNAIKLFLEMNEISLPWKKISKGLPKVKRYAEDRAPTIQELRQICEYPDRRIKAIVYTMCSSGVRLGFWENAKWKQVIPIEKNGIVVAAKLIVYPGTDEEYFTFISISAYKELMKWKTYREQSGEVVTPESYIMRHIWNTKKGYTRGLITAPLQLKPEGIKRLIDDALWTQGIREKLQNGKKRHPFQTDHGFRKWFKTRCEMSGMRSLDIEILLNHSTGLTDSYYRITEEELLEGYLKYAAPYLTIEKESILVNEFTKLNEKNLDNERIIKTKLQEKNEEIEQIKKNEQIKEDVLSNLSDQLVLLTNRIKDLERKQSQSYTS